jgi:hypothetical protein
VDRAAKSSSVSPYCTLPVHCIQRIPQEGIADLAIAAFFAPKGYRICRLGCDFALGHIGWKTAVPEAATKRTDRRTGQSVGSKAARRSGWSWRKETLRYWYFFDLPQRFVCPIEVGEHPVWVFDAKLDFITVDFQYPDYNVVANDDGLIRGEKEDAHWPTSLS